MLCLRLEHTGSKMASWVIFYFVCIENVNRRFNQYVIYLLQAVFINIVCVFKSISPFFSLHSLYNTLF